MAVTKQPAVFVDRDDTLIKDSGYMRDPAQIHIIPGVPAALRKLRDDGFAVVIVTNQSGIARGFLTEEELRSVHEALQEQLAERGSAVDAIYYCPYLDGRDAKVEEYRMDSELRKPRPGMLLKAAADLHLDLDQSWMVGDKASDVEAGRAAGCRTIMIGSGADGDAARPDHLVPDFARAADLILRESQRLAEMRAIVSRARQREAESRQREMASTRRPIEDSSSRATTAPQPPPPSKPIEAPKPPPVERQIEAPKPEPPQPKPEMTMKPTEATRPDAAPRTESQDKKTETAKAEPTGATEKRVPASSNDGSAFDVLHEILDELRLIRRDRQFQDFSFAQLAGAIAQAFALFALAYGLYSVVNEQGETGLYSLLSAMVFQLMALTGFMVTRRR